MALTFPVYVRVDPFNTSPGVGPFVPPAQSGTSGLADGPGSITRGLIVGIRVFLEANTGSVADNIPVRIYLGDDVAGEELFSSVYNFTGVGETLTDTLNTPVPFFQQPFTTVAPTVAGTVMNVTLYVRAIA
jgi:hypothetical protein|tara:strand:- start:914 stop:1306 length:393 start_codon:yes stop_codon:yes gene_type:complete